MNRNNPLAMSYAYGTRNPYLSRPDATWTDEERRRITEEKRMIARYKTSLCTDFRTTGNCMYGDNCRFAHGADELREKPQPKNAKTVLCRNFEKYGICPYGGRCLFIHRGKQKDVAETTRFTSPMESSAIPTTNRVSLASSTLPTRNPLASSTLPTTYRGPLASSSVGQRPPNRLSQQVSQQLDQQLKRFSQLSVSGIKEPKV